MFRLKNFRDVKKGKVDTWDFQWMYTRLDQSMLSIIPKVSLIENVGLGADATHTKSSRLTAQVIKSEDLKRLGASWKSPKGPSTVIPNFDFELKVLQFKRGFRGLGPLWLTTRLLGCFCS